jgi:hypothetical protein
MHINGERPGTFTAEVLRATYGLMENVAELSQHAMRVVYRPADSRDFHSHVIRWAIEWEELFAAKVATGEYHADEWIERIEAFALNKLFEVRDDCENWPASWSALT